MESHDRGEIAGEQGGHTDSEKQQPTVKDKLLNASAVRQVYLVTCSQANWNNFQLEDRLPRRSSEVFTHLTHALCTGYVVESRIETVVFTITWL